MIHIATVDLSTLDENAYQRLYALASPERRQQAERCLRKEVAQQCILAEAALRYALRSALGTDRVTLSNTKSGKPYITERSDFHFNLSHAGSWVVIAWADLPVGIDVETIRMDESKERLAQRFYHSREQAYLFAAQGQERAQRFFEIWTKKESYLKYLGTGIDRALNSFSVLDLPEVTFHSCLLENAVLTLCAADSEYDMISLTPEMLLSD